MDKKDNQKPVFVSKELHKYLLIEKTIKGYKSIYELLISLEDIKRIVETHKIKESEVNSI